MISAGDSEASMSLCLGQLECCFGYLGVILDFVRGCLNRLCLSVTVSHVLLSSCRSSHAVPKRACSCSSMSATLKLL